VLVVAAYWLALRVDPATAAAYAFGLVYAFGRVTAWI